MTASAAPNESVAGLHPAYFALVMATGIVSIAAWLLGMPLIGQALLAVNALAYAILWLATLLRLTRYADRMTADFMDHGRSVGYFTIVAGTCVFGNQLLLIAGMPRLAEWLWYLAIALWLLLTYGIFTVLTCKTEKPTLDRGLPGGWLLSVVATQAVSVLGGLLAPSYGEHQEFAHFFTLLVWLAGGMLYIWIISLIFYRYTFVRMAPADLAPPYWINMGAMAISTLAGAILIQNAAGSSLLEQLLPFIKGLTLLFWATATWWIPMLLTLGFWRHIVRRFPLRYDPLYWGAVFPLGMYTVCTFRLSSAVGAPFLESIPQWFVYIALAAWLLAFAGLLGHCLKLIKGPGSAH